MPNPPLDLSELRRLHEAATPGPWFVEIEAEPDDRDDGSEQPEVYVVSDKTVCDATVVATMGTASAIPNRRKRDDAHLIVKMRNSIGALLSRTEALEEENGRLRCELDKIKRDSWCWIPGDDTSYDYPLEWAEYDLDPKTSPIIQEFAWAGRLPPTWAVFMWAGDDDGGEWNVVEYESEAAALAALPSAPTNGGER